MRLPIYLDYMATTPVDERVIKKMQACLGIDGIFGNPASRNHLYGWKAEEAIGLARVQVADAIRADAREIIWTSGATEAINLALKGVCWFYRRSGKHIVTCETEHKAGLEVCHYLQSQGFEVTYLKVKPNGLIDLDAFSDALRDDTILVSIMHVNNEIGVIQDIQAMSDITRTRGILFHVDAAQSLGKIPIDIQALQVDLMSISAHKVYGPKGVGALFVRKNPQVHLTPLFHGSSYEHGLRPGTLATHQIVGMGEACYLAQHALTETNEKLFVLRERLWNGIKSLGNIHLNGDYKKRVSSNLNVSIAGVEGETLFMALKDLAISSGAACTSASMMPSHVLQAIGRSDDLAHSSIRFSLGRYTTTEEIDYAILQCVEKVKQLRGMAPLWRVN